MMRVRNPRTTVAAIDDTLPGGIGPRICWRRQQQEWTTDQLAARLGVAESYVREVEAGDWTPSAELLALLAETFYVKREDL